jgi:endonuclease-3
MITPELFRRFPDAESMAAAPIAEVEELVRTAGVFRNKSKNIKLASSKIVEDFDSNVPDTMENLLKLPGVGRKTANVILGNAFNKNVGVVVDTHVNRLSNRLGFTDESDPDKIEKDLMKIIPRDDWALFAHLMIRHGRMICNARNPDCPNCFLKDICPSSTA